MSADCPHCRRSADAAVQCADDLGRTLAAERAAREAAEREVARLTALLGAVAEAHERDLLAVWQALGGSHEPPGSIEDVVAEAQALRHLARVHEAGAVAARADADRERRARETLEGAVREERLAREESAAADCCLAEVLNEAVAMRGRGTARRTTAARERVEAAHRREIAATAALDALLTGGEVGG